MRGGLRKGAGRPAGTGKWKGERTKSFQVPESLAAEVEALMAQHAARYDSANSCPQPAPLLTNSWPNAELFGTISALDMLQKMQSDQRHFDVVHMDPWYRANTPSGRRQYARETIPLIHQASKITDHILMWGFPQSVALLIDRWPSTWKLSGWISWHYKNAQTRARSWRPSQYVCLHISSPEAKMRPQAFFNEAQNERFNAGTLKYLPCPMNVVIQPLICGFVLRSENMGFSGQKPIAVTEHVLKMCLPPGGHVLDPTGGTGTTAVAAKNLGASATISDRSQKSLNICNQRLQDLFGSGH